MRVWLRSVAVPGVTTVAGTLAAFVVASAVIAGPVRPAFQTDHPNHSYHNHRHVGSMHGGNYEDWCAETEGEMHLNGIGQFIVPASPITSFTLSELQNRVDNTLRLENTSADWHRANSDSRLVFNLGADTKNCTELSEATRDAMDIEVWAWGPNAGDVDDIREICNYYGSATSCVFAPTTEVYTNYNGPVVHNDYHKLEVHLLYSQVNGAGSCPWEGICERRRTINHEFGHVLGLDDCHTGESCGPDGVMHDPNGNPTDWPTSYERTTVTDLIADLSSAP